MFLLPDGTYRWGIYDSDQMFAVFDPEEVERLIVMIRGF
jgi:hypothetical protein